MFLNVVLERVNVFAHSHCDFAVAYANLLICILSVLAVALL